ncbi:MAG: sensor histidine kinase [Cyanobacteria bacterium RYN_339]|nr:sensor histidine kinase [Cyanobacteria bacterium RYN_339]
MATTIRSGERRTAVPSSQARHADRARLDAPGGRELADRVAAIARIRWVLAVVAFLYASAIALYERRVGLHLGLPGPLFMALLPLAIAAYNALVLVALRTRGAVVLAAWIGIAGDLLAATVALEGTGGAGSWLWTLFPMITLQAAFLTERPRATGGVALLGLGCYVVGAFLAERRWLAVVDISRVAVASQAARGMVGLQATWVGIMDLLAALAGLMALDVLARIHGELRSAYRQLDEQYRALDQLERLKSAFMSGVSHEMRTPLAIIQGHAEALVDDVAVAAGHREAAKEIEEQAVALGAKITQVLAYASLAAGEAPLQRCEASVNDLVQAAVAGATDDCGRSGAIVAVGPFPRELALVGDPVMVAEALRQLIRNACAVTPRGATVHVTATETSGQVAFEVQDAGPGLPAPVRAALGEPFTQAGSGLTEHRPGLGLGLAYARLVASVHGGSLEAEDRAAGGTVLRLRIPRG